MENFNYHRPSKVADAVKLMKKAKDGKYLSGGHTLLPTMKQGLAAPTDIIDLSGLKNAGVKVGAKSVVIQAGTTHAAVAGQGPEARPFPALRHWRAASATPMSATRARLAARSPTMTRRRIIRRPAWRWVPPSTPMPARFRRTSISPACSRPR
jgi:CO/xanthine dehydrogenase FAD-binding subunit